MLVRRKNKVHNQVLMVFYDPEEGKSSNCAICFKHRAHKRLVNPCKCNILYHHRCLLLYIKQRLCQMGNQIDFSQIRCHRCESMIKFFHVDHTYYGCSHFLKQIKSEGCNKSMVVLFGILLFIIAIAILIGNLDIQKTNVIFYWSVIGVETVLFLVFFFVLVSFIHRSFTYKQIILIKVYDYAQIMKNNSSSSERTPPTMNSESFQILIDQNY